jgi:hypothetical protein
VHDPDDGIQIGEPRKAMADQITTRAKLRLR